MANTIVKPTRSAKYVVDVPPGAIFEYVAGEAAYIKTDKSTIVNLRNGQVYCNASNGPINVLSWVRLETAA